MLYPGSVVPLAMFWIRCQFVRGAKLSGAKLSYNPIRSELEMAHNPSLWYWQQSKWLSLWAITKTELLVVSQNISFNYFFSTILKAFLFWVWAKAWQPSLAQKRLSVLFSWEFRWRMCASSIWTVSYHSQSGRRSSQSAIRAPLVGRVCWFTFSLQFLTHFVCDDIINTEIILWNAAKFHHLLQIKLSTCTCVLHSIPLNRQS